MNKRKRFSIETAEMGERIDKIISQKFPEYSRNYFLNLIKTKKVRVNNKSIKPSYLVRVGDSVEVELGKTIRAKEAKGENIDLDIIYEDNNVIVVNKQPGIVVHPSAGHTGGTLVNAIIGYFPAIKNVVYDKASEISLARPGLVHRLDKDTSGVIIVAKNDKSMRSLSKQIQNRHVKKTYFALCDL